MELKDIIALVLGTMGTTLGIVNTIHTLSMRRVRLRVIPKTAFIIGGGAGAYHRQDGIDEESELMCIEVVNLSAFPVTVSEVGFTLPGSRNRAVVTQPLMFDGKQWPRRLEPREAVSAYGQLDAVSPGIGKAYAKTDCGVTRYGTSAALKAVKQRLSGRG